MRLESKDNPVLRSGIESDLDEAMEVELTPKMFEILAGGLYSDQISAVLRELGCNAADSHVWAGKADVPFIVTLPTTLDSTLSIKDEGVGMDDNEFRTIWKKWGASNKTTDDTQTGAWGLGSKSPFGYTDSYTVIAIKDGWVRTYYCYVDEEKLPHLTRVSEEQTDLPNGVEVKVPVKSADIHSFRIKAQRVFHWFGHKHSSYHVRPNICASNWFWSSDDNFIYEGEDYALLKNQGTSYAVMGNVAYPVSQDDFDDKSKRKFNEIELLLLNHGVILYLPLVGEDGLPPVIPAGGREKLKCNSRTIQTIKAKLSKVADRIIADVQKSIQDCESLWEARMLYRKIMGTGGVYETNSIIHNIFKDAKIKGVTYDGFDLSKNISAYKSWKVPVLGEDGNQRKQVSDGSLMFTHERGKLVNLTGHSCRRMRRRRGYSAGYKVDRGNYSEINPCDGLVFFIDDASKPHKRIEKYLLDSQEEKTVYLVSECDGEHSISINQWLEREGLNDVSVDGGPVVKRVSELPAPVRDTSRKTTKTAKAVICTGEFSYDTESVSWEDHDIDLDEGGVYVEINRYKWRAGLLSGEDFRSPADYGQDQLSEVYECVKRLVGHNFQLIGLRTALVDRVKSRVKYQARWMRLDDFILLRVAEYYNHANDSLDGDVYETLSLPVSKDLDFSDGEFSANSPFDEFFKELNRIRTVAQNHNVVRYRDARTVFSRFMEKAGNPFPKPNTSDIKQKANELREQFNKLLKTYPMLTGLDSWDWNSIHDRIIDYVKIMDWHRAVKKTMESISA